MSEYLIGGLVGLSVGVFGKVSGFDRDRSFYPTALIVIAAYYVLFATMSGSNKVLLTETLIASGFLLLAVIGFKKSTWLVAAAIAGHGVFDLVHSSFITNTGMPVWWPGFCAAADIVIGGWLAFTTFTDKENTRVAAA